MTSLLVKRREKDAQVHLERHLAPRHAKLCVCHVAARKQMPQARAGAGLQAAPLKNSVLLALKAAGRDNPSRIISLSSK
ncbi:MAG: hypothetical protein H7228_03760 [Polaromonas sp.]|nr:hypothetical protein [Polaromonas sp.]